MSQRSLFVFPDDTAQPIVDVQNSLRIKMFIVFDLEMSLQDNIETDSEIEVKTD